MNWKHVAVLYSCEGKKMSHFCNVALYLSSMFPVLRTGWVHHMWGRNWTGRALTGLHTAESLWGVE